jgi:hypothetical protein
MTSPLGSSGLGISQNVAGILPLPSLISPRFAIRCKRSWSSKLCLPGSRGVSPEFRVLRRGFPLPAGPDSDRSSVMRFILYSPSIRDDGKYTRIVVAASYAVYIQHGGLAALSARSALRASLSAFQPRSAVDVAPHRLPRRLGLRVGASLANPLLTC